jgi:hypothetical protein
MPVGLEDQPRVLFKQNPLKVVVTQVRFPPIYSLEQAAGIAPLQDAIRSEFPIAEPRAQQVSIPVGPAGPGQPITGQGPWRFLSEDGTWTVSVAQDYIAVETTEYKRYEEFRAKAQIVFQAAVEVLQVSRRTRFGLRYVDEIEHPEARSMGDWARFIKPSLLGAAGDQLKEHVTQAIEQIDLTVDDADLTIRHGYLKPTSERSVYVIDLDAHDDRTQPFGLEHTLGQMDAYKGWIWSFFVQSITDELIAYLEPEQP